MREHGNCRHQRIEASFGQEVLPKWFTISKVFLEDATDNTRSAKAETSIVSRFGQMDIGLGFRQEFSGNFQESGVILSVERRS